MGICTQDTTEEATLRKYCAEWMEKAFAGQKSATAQEIENRVHSSSINLPGYDKVVIRKPVTAADLMDEFKALRVFLQGILDELKLEDSFRIDVNRKP